VSVGQAQAPRLIGRREAGGSWVGSGPYVERAERSARANEHKKKERVRSRGRSKVGEPRRAPILKARDDGGHNGCRMCQRRQRISENKHLKEGTRDSGGCRVRRDLPLRTGVGAWGNKGANVEETGLHRNGGRYVKRPSSMGAGGGLT